MTIDPQQAGASVTAVPEQRMAQAEMPNGRFVPDRLGSALAASVDASARLDIRPINSKIKPGQPLGRPGGEALASLVPMLLKEAVAMRINPGSYQFDDATVSDSDLIGFSTPREIVEDMILSHERKRQLLAYWASDIHAVVGAPALRTYLMGPVVTIDEIKAALIALDEMVDFAAIPKTTSNSAIA